MVSNKTTDVNRVSTSASSSDTWQLVEALEGLAVDENAKPAIEQTTATSTDQSSFPTQDNIGGPPATGSADGEDTICKDFGDDGVVKSGNDRNISYSTGASAPGIASSSKTTNSKKKTISSDFAPSPPSPGLSTEGASTIGQAAVPATAAPGTAPPSYTDIVNKKTIKQEFAPSPPLSPPALPDATNKPFKLCRGCDRPATPKVVGPENINGNVGRPYYACENEICPSYDTKYKQGWVTWNDNKGIHESNPRCDCGSPSRQDRIGKDEGKRGQGFWTCATGDCDYHSQDYTGRTVWGGEREAFMPGML